MLKYLTAWLVMLLASIVNGSIRDFTYGKHMTELTAHQISTGSEIVVLGLIIWGYIRLYRPTTGYEAILIGLLWTGLTVAFEFLFFHFIGGYTWSGLLNNYNIFRGRIWIAVLIWLTVGPYIFFRLSRS